MLPNAVRIIPLSRRCTVFTGVPSLRSPPLTTRTIYTVRFRNAIYVLHAFKKKSKKGIATPKKEMDLIARRLAAAERDHKDRQN